MPHSIDSREVLTAPRSQAAQALGPYEFAYDVRRGYTEADSPAERPVRRDDGEVWRGRARDER